MIKHIPYKEQSYVPSGQKLAGLQLLRAQAAIMVLIGHMIAEAEHFFALNLPGDMIPWTRGVDVFFVISGFVITLSAARYMGQARAFFVRRVLRVVPLYWFFTTLMVAALLLVPGGVKDTQFDPMQVLSSYGFFPYERADGRIAPVLSLGWTLNYEVFFYAILALCLTLPRPLLASVCAIFGLVLIGVLYQFESPQWTFWTHPLLIEFVFGIALAKLWQKGWVLPSWWAAALGMGLGLILLIVLDDLDLPRFVAAGIPATLMVASGTLLCPQCPLPGVIWGDASYALYLSHRFVLRAATLILLPMLPATQAFALIYVLVVCIAAMVAALLTYLWIEKPMLRAFEPRPKQAPA